MARNYNPSAKGGTWGDGRNLPQIAESDGSYSEGIAALLRGWNEVSCCDRTRGSG